jgi:hypothetical protein
LLAQLGADVHGLPGPHAGRRGDVGQAQGLPGEPLTDARIEAVLAAAREHGHASDELHAFEWATLDRVRVGASNDSGPGPALIPLQVGRGLFEPSVRETSWCEGGVAVWERPEIVVSITPRAEEARLRVELLDVLLARPEHLPATLREREWTERILGWSLADFATPTVPIFVATRTRGQALSLTAEIPPCKQLLLALEDVCGQRHVRQLQVAVEGGHPRR